MQTEKGVRKRKNKSNILNNYNIIILFRNNITQIFLKIQLS